MCSFARDCIENVRPSFNLDGDVCVCVSSFDVVYIFGVRRQVTHNDCFVIAVNINHIDS